MASSTPIEDTMRQKVAFNLEFFREFSRMKGGYWFFGSLAYRRSLADNPTNLQWFQ